jgi:hypothetical protein
MESSENLSRASIRLTRIGNQIDQNPDDDMEDDNHDSASV